MSKGVAVVASVDDAGRRLASAVAGLASYSIDPPSVVASVPRELLPRLGTGFGVSLLEATQHRIAAELWEGPHDVTDSDIGFTDGSLVPGALGGLVCKADMAAEALGRGIVVGRATTVVLGGGTPLLAGGLAAQ
jgi:hypothetical protein